VILEFLADTNQVCTYPCPLHDLIFDKTYVQSLSLTEQPSYHLMMAYATKPHSHGAKPKDSDVQGQTTMTKAMKDKADEFDKKLVAELAVCPNHCWVPVQD
jgi:hypothetical protein